jgi:heptosyltransferase-1
MTALHQLICSTQHIALHAAVRKIFENQECKIQNRALQSLNIELYAKIPPMPKLLIVKTSSLGDVIHNLPIIADIRAQHADIEIDWLVEASFADIPKLHPHVNEVIPVAIRQWRKTLFTQNTWQQIKLLKQTLSDRQYDLVLDSQGLLKSALLTTLTRGQKHGYDRHSIREPLASFFYDVRHTVSRQQHAVARNRQLAAAAFGYAMPSQLPDYGLKVSTAIAVQLPTPYIIGLHGTSRDSKLWETTHWIALGKELAARYTQLVLPWSNAAELKRAEFIASKLQNVTVLPKLTIHQLALALKQAQAAVGVDTGLSHLAAALDVPTVALYTDTDPGLTGVCAGAFAPAVNLGGIQQSPSVQQVLEALNQVLVKTSV